MRVRAKPGILTATKAPSAEFQRPNPAHAGQHGATQPASVAMRGVRHPAPHTGREPRDKRLTGAHVGRQPAQVPLRITPAPCVEAAILRFRQIAPRIGWAAHRAH